MNPHETLYGALRAPRHLVFGAGQRFSLPRYVKQLGETALIVTDERLANDPIFTDVVAQIRGAGVRFSVFSDVRAELPLACIEAGVVAAKAVGAQVVVGFGGGSCVDAAKAIALLLSHGGDASDYYGEFKVPGPTIPVIAVPTTAGTGSEVTPVAVLADPGRAMKIGIASPNLIPHTAICDPELTYSCPPSLTAHSGADALTHAIEAYTTARRQPDPQISHEHVFLGKSVFTDHFALAAIRQISGSLKRVYDDGSDVHGRFQLMLGATNAGLAFGTAGTAAAHAAQYPIGALTGTPHGLGVAVMLPYVMAFNRPFCESELADVAGAMGLDDNMGSAEASRSAIRTVADLFASIGIPPTLADLGIRQDQIADIAAQALLSARLVKNNPRPIDLAAMTSLLEAALHGKTEALD